MSLLLGRGKSYKKQQHCAAETFNSKHSQQVNFEHAISVHCHVIWY